MQTTGITLNEAVTGKKMLAFDPSDGLMDA